MSQESKSLENKSEPLILNGVYLYPDTKVCIFLGEEVQLTDFETKVLEVLMSKPGIWFSRDEIMDRLNISENADNRTIDTRIRMLRKKLYKDREIESEFIGTLYRRGYRVNDWDSERKIL